MIQIASRVPALTITNVAAWPIELKVNGYYLDTRKKSLETRSEGECFNFS